MVNLKLKLTSFVSTLVPCFPVNLRLCWKLFDTAGKDCTRIGQKRAS